MTRRLVLFARRRATGLAWLAAAGTLAVGPRAMAQSPETAPALRLVAKADTVLVYVPGGPGAVGFLVYRRPPGAGDAAWERRTTEPVTPVRDPGVAAGRLGPDLALALRAARAADAPEMLRRLLGDRFAAGVVSYLSRPAALVLGRLFVDTAATRGAEYEYRVAFTDAAGAETGRSAMGHVRVVDVEPAAPPAPAARSADHEIVLTWHYRPFTGDPADLVVGFHVYRASAAGAAGRRLTVTPVLRNDAPGAVLEFRDDEPANGVPVRYALTAVDIAGRESPPGPAVLAQARDVTPPGVPTDLAVRSGDGAVTVTWRLAPETDVAGYHIERSMGLSQPYARLDRVLIPAARPLWTDTVAGGRQYFYRVTAVDSAGNASAPSNPVPALPADNTPPAPPANLTVAAARGRLTVRWNASPSHDVLGYWVYRGEAGRFVRLSTRPVVALEVTDSGYGGNGGGFARLTPGTRYTIRVSAVDSAFNESAKVETVVLVPDDQPPAPPSALRVQNVRGRYVSVSWDASPDRDVARYVLARSGGGAPPIAGLAFGAGGREWRDTAVVHGASYVYRLTAVDSAGNVSSAVTDSLRFRDVTPPPPPRAASARLVAGVVEVRWERVIAAELVGYNVYRSTVPTGVYARLTSAPVTGLTFADSTGHAGLFYLVRAVDRSGNESVASPVVAVTAR